MLQIIRYKKTVNLTITYEKYKKITPELTICNFNIQFYSSLTFKQWMQIPSQLTKAFRRFRIETPL